MKADLLESLKIITRLSFSPLFILFLLLKDITEVQTSSTYYNVMEPPLKGTLSLINYYLVNIFVILKYYFLNIPIPYTF